MRAMRKTRVGGRSRPRYCSHTKPLMRYQPLVPDRRFHSRNARSSTSAQSAFFDGQDASSRTSKLPSGRGIATTSSCRRPAMIGAGSARGCSSQPIITRSATITSSGSSSSAAHHTSGAVSLPGSNPRGQRADDFLPQGDFPAGRKHRGRSFPAIDDAFDLGDRHGAVVGVDKLHLHPRSNTPANRAPRALPVLFRPWPSRGKLVHWAPSRDDRLSSATAGVTLSTADTGCVAMSLVG